MGISSPAKGVVMNRSTIVLAIAAIAGVALATGSVAADDGGVGICVVGADSPCNDNPAANETRSDHPDGDLREPSDGLPLAPDDPDVVEPVPEPQSPLPPPRYGDGSVTGECIGNATVMCGPTDLTDPNEVDVHDVTETIDDDIQCVRAPCELLDAGQPVRESAATPPFASFGALFEFVRDFFIGYGF